MKSQIKAHFFDHRDPISITELLKTLKPVCDTNNIHEEAVIWVLSHFVWEILARALKRHMYAEDCLSLLVASMRNKEQRSRETLQPYLETEKFLLKKHATDQANAEIDDAILCYVQSPTITP